MDTAYQQSLMGDPDTAYNALQAQWINLETAFGISVIPIIIPAIQDLADGLNAFALACKDSPMLTRTMTLGFIGLMSALTFGGVVMTLIAGFKSLKLAFNIIKTIAGFDAEIRTLADALALFSEGSKAIAGLRLLAFLIGCLAAPLAVLSALWPKETQKDDEDTAKLKGETLEEYHRRKIEEQIKGGARVTDLPLGSVETPTTLFYPQRRPKHGPLRDPYIYEGGSTVIAKPGQHLGPDFTPHRLGSGSGPIFGRSAMTISPPPPTPPDFTSHQLRFRGGPLYGHPGAAILPSLLDERMKPSTEPPVETLRMPFIQMFEGPSKSKPKTGGDHSSTTTPSYISDFQIRATQETKSLQEEFLRTMKSNQDDMLSKLTHALLDAIRTGLSNVSVKMDGRTVGALLNDISNRNMDRPPRDSGRLDGRSSPFYPAVST